MTAPSSSPSDLALLLSAAYEKGRAKLELALARGKKLYDKRGEQKKRSCERERGRPMCQKG
jgi:SsrA-binding protein